MGEAYSKTVDFLLTAKRDTAAQMCFLTIKRVTKPMLNFKSFRYAGCVLAGIESCT
jgi:transposase-like protein